jgi:citrate lyase subunit beta / citryl-CoA lyase
MAKPGSLRRSALSVPATQLRMMERGMSSHADTIFFDLEDSVPGEGKDKARHNVIQMAKQKPPELFLGVRVNAWSTKWCYRDIIEVVTAVGDYIDYIILAKAETRTDVAAVAGLLSQVEQDAGISRRILIEPCLESGVALLDAREILTASDRVFSALFGPNGFDFAADMHFFGGVRQDYLNATAVMAVAAARTARLPLIDGPYALLHDEAGLRRVAMERFRMGFDGMWAIHPDQIDVINDCFTPPAEMVEDAVATVEACERASDSGHGAAIVRGAMVDTASVRLSRSVLERSELCAELTRKGTER